MKKLKVILIGAGNRGVSYTDIMKDAFSDRYEVIAVAEPIDSRREYIKDKHNISEDMCFSDWKPLIELGKIADIAIISTMDRAHYDPTIAAIEQGYDILLEKPIAVTAVECMGINQAAEKHNVKVVVCTVLRYTPLFNYLKDIIDSGRIGDVVNITHKENVGNVHQSHSFVRGNWGNEGRSSFMLLQKCCHDMDILQWLISKKCIKVQSFGSLTHFTRDNAPEGSPEYCVEGCPKAESCPYNAVKLYYDDKENDWFRTTSTREAYPTDEMVMNAIKTTQYGKCVYKCDNDVVDHQVVNMLFEGGATVSFTMAAFNKGGRYLEIMGTKGVINTSMTEEEDDVIDIFDYETRKHEIIPMSSIDGILGGHGGGDSGIVKTLYEYLCGTYEGKSVPEIDDSCNNHLITFAAEESRRSGQVVDMEEFKAKFN